MEDKVDFEKYENARIRGELIFFGGIALLGILSGSVWAINDYFKNLEQKTQDNEIIDTTRTDLTNYQSSINYFEAKDSSYITQ